MIALVNRAPLRAGVKAERDALQRMKERDAGDDVAVTVSYLRALLEAAVMLDEIDRLTHLRIVRPESDSQASCPDRAPEATTGPETASEGDSGASKGVRR